MDGEQVQAVAAVQEQVLHVVRIELDAKIGWVVAIAFFTPLLKIRKMFGRNDPCVLFGKLLDAVLYLICLPIACRVVGRCLSRPFM